MAAMTSFYAGTSVGIRLLCIRLLVVVETTLKKPNKAPSFQIGSG